MSSWEVPVGSDGTHREEQSIPRAAQWGDRGRPRPRTECPNPSLPGSTCSSACSQRSQEIFWPPGNKQELNMRYSSDTPTSGLNDGEKIPSRTETPKKQI